MTNLSEPLQPVRDLSMIVPVSELPPVTDGALKLKLWMVGVTAAGCTTKLKEVDTAPSASGFATVIGNVPGAVRLLPGSSAVSCVALTKLVTRGAALNIAFAPGTKFEPLMASVRSPPPCTTEFGLTLFSDGAATTVENSPVACVITE